MKKTNFDTYLDEQMMDPSFAARCGRASDAWDVAAGLNVAEGGAAYGVEK